MSEKTNLESLARDYKEAQAGGEPILKPNVGWVHITEPSNEGKTGNLKSAKIVSLHHQDLSMVGLPVMADPSLLAGPPGRGPMGAIVGPTSCLYCNNMTKHMPKPVLVPGTERDYLVSMRSVVAWKWEDDSNETH